MQIDVLEVDGKIYGFSGMYRPFVRQSAVYSKRSCLSSREAFCSAIRLTSFAGCHRYEAFQRLGRETIWCRVRKANQNTLRMHMM